MKTLMELGEAVAMRRKALKLHQSDVAGYSGLSRETIVRFERGQLTDLGARKLMGVLAALGMEMTITPVGTAGTLDDLRRERAGN